MRFLVRIRDRVYDSTSKYYFHPSHAFSIGGIEGLILEGDDILPSFWLSCLGLGRRGQEDTYLFTCQTCLQEMLHWVEDAWSATVWSPVHSSFRLLFTIILWYNFDSYFHFRPIHVLFLPWTIWKYVADIMTLHCYMLQYTFQYHFPT